MLYDTTTCVLTKDYLLEIIDEIMSLSNDLEWDYWDKDNFLKDLKDKWKLSFVVKSGSKIIGYAILSRKPEKTLYLHHLIISKEYRGNGIGLEMLKRMRNLALEHGFSQIILKVGRLNTIALNFYRRFGFNCCDEHNSYDYIIMTLSI